MVEGDQSQDQHQPCWRWGEWQLSSKYSGEEENNSETQEITSWEPLPSPLNMFPFHFWSVSITFLMPAWRASGGELWEGVFAHRLQPGANLKKAKAQHAKILSGWWLGIWANATGFLSNRSPSRPRWFAERMRKRRPRWTFFYLFASLRKQLIVTWLATVLKYSLFKTFLQAIDFFSLFQKM